MLTMASALDRAQRLYGARPAIVDREGVFTWGRFIDRARRAASLLAALGVGRGERYAILSRNTFRHAELICAGYWSGRIPVPINFRLAAPEIRYILDDAGCKVLFAEDVFENLVNSQELAPWRDDLVRIAPKAPGAHVREYESLIAGASSAALYESAEDDDAILLYTGGTTGRSKGVRLSHRNVYSNGMQVAPAMRVRFDDVYLHVAPMFHSADLLGTAFTLAGAAHAYLPQFSGTALLEAIRDYRVTMAMLAPTMIIMTLQEPDIASYDLSSFRLIFYGSAPMAVEWVRRTMERFPTAEVQQGYGLTETSPILTTLDMEEHREALATGEFGRLKSIGRPVFGIDLRIMDDEGREVPTGEAGEIAVRGPNVTEGYLNRPDENARAFRGGWFRTGDVARMDAEGYVYLLDRKKDMIITGGENVYSSEVEAVLYQHPKVHECAVIGVPDDTYGEALFAAIVAAPGQTVTEDEIIAHCRGKIGGYKIPRRMAFLGALPKSAMGKILKTELRKTYAGRDKTT
jgi:long-chain acyl-CoA synthetase